LSARNRFKAIVTDVKTEGLVEQVEMVVSGPVRLVAISAVTPPRISTSTGDGSDGDHEVDLRHDPQLSAHRLRSARQGGVRPDPALVPVGHRANKPNSLDVLSAALASIREGETT
jgi:hypothetical protein